MGIVCAKDCSGAVTSTLPDYMDRVCGEQRATKRDFQLTGKGTQLTRYSERACKVLFVMILNMIYYDSQVFCLINGQTTASDNNLNYRFYGDNLPDGTPCGQAATDNKYCVSGECMVSIQ
jgi:hypothetical protein